MRKYFNSKRVDELGRVVIPVDIRKKLDINTGDKLEIFLEDNIIGMTKPDSDNIVVSIGEIIDIAGDSNKITRSEYGQLCSILNKLKASYEQVKNEEVN